MSSGEAEDLFGRVMIGLDNDEHKDEDSPTGRRAIVQLLRMASREVLEIALAASVDAEPLRRRVAAAVLGQLGHTKIGFEPIFVEQRYRGLVGLLNIERDGRRDPGVLSEACIALGHIQDPRAVEAVLTLREHPVAEVRLGVVHGLSGHEAPDAIKALIVLSSDIDDDVRDWATFGLAQQIDADAPSLRAALHARLDDPCADIRNEAIEGLAKRGDQSVLPFLIRELHRGVALPLFDAAAALATPELCKVLAASAGPLMIEASHGQYDLTSAWTEAMEACGCQLPSPS